MKLHVFIQPSQFEGAWKDAVTRVARAQGWRVASLTEVGITPDADKCLFLSSDTEPNLPDAMNVAITSFEDGPKFLRSIGFSEHDALRRSAHFLAYASEIARENGAVFDASREVFALPYIGEVRRDAVPSLPASGLNTQALNVYRNLPPLMGAEANWDPYLFAYDTERDGLSLGAQGEVNLTGRARLLIFGPQITLSPGLWKVAADVLIDPEGSRSRLTVSWGNVERQNTRIAEIDRPGVYQINLSNEWKMSSEAEVKISSNQPHFRGKVKLLNASVSRHKINGEE